VQIHCAQIERCYGVRSERSSDDRRARFPSLLGSSPRARRRRDFSSPSVATSDTWFTALRRFDCLPLVPGASVLASVASVDAMPPARPATFGSTPSRQDWQVRALRPALHSQVSGSSDCPLTPARIAAQ
jgi:hypothetical protein